MAESKLRNLSIEFSVKIIKLCENLKGHYSLTNQLERSGTSIGANITSANLQELANKLGYSKSYTVTHIKK